MRALLAALLLLGGCAKSEKLIIYPISFYDTAGALHRVGKDQKPSLLVFWITNCGYCARTMAVLDQVRSRYPADKLDVVGVYLNNATPREVAQFAEQEGHKMPVAAGQDGSMTLLESFINAFGFTAPGRDVYFVDGAGRVKALQTYPDVVQAVEQATGLKPVEPAAAAPVVYSSERP